MSSPVWRRRRRGVRARIARRHAARIEALFAPYMTSGEAFMLIQAGLLEKVGTLAARYSHGWEHAYRQRCIVGMPADEVQWDETHIWVDDEMTPYLEAVGKHWASEIGDWLWPAASEDEPSGQ